VSKPFTHLGSCCFNNLLREVSYFIVDASQFVFRLKIHVHDDFYLTVESCMDYSYMWQDS
jgi:hypothetical protein